MTTATQTRRALPNFANRGGPLDDALAFVLDLFAGGVMAGVAVKAKSDTQVTRMLMPNSCPKYLKIS